MNEDNTYCVSQTGARQHYEIAAMLHLHGQLDLLVTDFWNYLTERGATCARHTKIGRLIKASDRFSSAVPRRAVRVPPSMVLSALRRRPSLLNRRATLEHAVRYGQRFSREVVKYLRRSRSSYLGFCSESLEALRFARLDGRWCVVDQYDAITTEEKILEHECEAFPQLTPGPFEPCTAYVERVRQEWELADKILVNSEWTRRALLSEGADDERICVVPIGFWSEPRREIKRKRKILKVLWLGSLTLTKGIQYAIEAAKKLRHAPVEFTFVGHSGVRLDRIQLPGNCSVLGPVPHSAVNRVYMDHDVFLFCTLSDGFGTVQLEAMSHGLPVIATTNCGSVVEDRVSGVVVRARSSDDIVAAIEEFVSVPGALESMSSEALTRVCAFAPSRIAELLVRAIAPPARGGEPGAAACAGKSVAHCPASARAM